MGDEKEAKALITACCSMNYDGKYFARELAEEQTLENLELFGNKLAKIHDQHFKGTERCKCI